MPPDPQTLLQQPMWTTALQFIHSPHNNSNSSSNTNNSTTSHANLLASGTAYKEVQVYDVRASSSTESAQGTTRRPVLHTPENLLLHRVTSILQQRDTNQLIVADAIGDCHILDMRKFHTGKQSSYQKLKSSHSSQEIGLGRLVGPGGSIRQLAMHPTLPLIACVGLDRKLWTWDINSKRMIDCIYLRQRLNTLLICEDEGWNGGEEGEDGERVMIGESGDWNEEGDDVQDYVDSDEEDRVVEDNSESNESSSDNTESESGESEEDDSTHFDESSSDEEEEEALPKHSKPKKKQRC